MDKLNTHKKNDKRLLEMHREIARQLQGHPEIVKKALQNIRNWIVSYEESGAAVPAVETDLGFNLYCSGIVPAFKNLFENV